MICLVGFMGAGKSSALARLEREGVVTADLDEAVEQREGASVETLFEERGEAGFREAEASVALDLLGDPAIEVLAMGGGSLLSDPVRDALRSSDHVVTWLRHPIEDCWKRVEGSGRPLARERESFERLFIEREPLYREAADAVITGGASNAVSDALDWLRLLSTGDLPVSTRMIWVPASTGGYPVLVGPGLSRTALLEPGGPLLPEPGRTVAILDHNVSEALDGLAPGLLGPIEVEPGEQSKSLAVAESVLRRMADLGLTREDRVLAIGGGVVGDLAGFCAATFQRGVDLVHCPTSLVAQVDSAYGGKTGVDLPEGKNYVGSFHQPSGVVTDTSLLETLPPEELSAGMAEVIKTGLLAGGSLWEEVRALGPGEILSRPDVVFECAAHKCEVVSSDERDSGLRATLNLGHTIGHAIETATGYSRYRHGEAVSLGLIAALDISGAEEIRAEVEGLAERHGLPRDLDPEVDPAAVIEAIRFDKKKTTEGVGFVLIEEPGTPRTGVIVPEDRIEAAVEGIRR